jgi:hypothetical protein
MGKCSTSPTLRVMVCLGRPSSSKVPESVKALDRFSPYMSTKLEFVWVVPFGSVMLTFE